MESKISAELLEVIQQEATKAAEKVYASKGTQYGIASVPTHTHNGVDSNLVPITSIEAIEVLPAIANGVVSPTVLGLGQVVDNPAESGLGNPATIPILAIPVIYGQGTTTAMTMTGAPGAGDTSATLTGNWGGSSGSFAVQFGSGEVRNVNFISGNTALTWTPALVWASGSANAVQIANSRFKGGEAPFGTVIGFRNDSDGIHQLWVKMEEGTTAGTWIGFDATQIFIGYD